MSNCSDPYTAALAAAMRWLSRREYAQLELHTKLSQRGFSDPIATKVMLELQAENLQSDQRYAETYTRARIKRGYGPKCIAYELQQKQISSKLIEQNLQMYNEEYWKELARNLVYKKINGKTLTNLTDKAKLVRFLQQKGYTHDQISYALRDITSSNEIEIG